MTKSIGLLDKFKNAVDVEDSIRIKLTKITPKDEVPSLEDAIATSGILVDAEHYFTATTMEVPFKGITVEEIPMQSRSSRKFLSTYSALPESLFPQVPEEFEPSCYTKIPRTIITLPSGKEFYVSETAEEIEDLVNKDRDARMNAAVKPVAKELQRVLGL